MASQHPRTTAATQMNEKTHARSASSSRRVSPFAISGGVLDGWNGRSKGRTRRRRKRRRSDKKQRLTDFIGKLCNSRGIQIDTVSELTIEGMMTKTWRGAHPETKPSKRRTPAGDNILPLKAPVECYCKGRRGLRGLCTTGRTRTK